MIVVLVLIGLLLGQRLPRQVASAATDPAMQAAPRRYGITFRREWAVPLLIVVAYVAHWGAVTAYLPVRAEAVAANIGLYFAADGFAIFIMRLPTGRLVERFALRTLILDRSRDDRGRHRDAAAAAHDADADRVGPARRSRWGHWS